MPQSISAILAMLMTTFFMLNQWRVVTASQIMMVQNEVDLMATEVAADLQDYVASFPFDENGAYGEGESWEAAQDIDDFDGKTYTAQVAGSAGYVDFNVEAVVYYVIKQGQRFVEAPEGVVTSQKEVVLTVTGPLGSTASISRVTASKG